ncbi:MAG TPA: LamG domain-containing protein [Sedimentisphaerales bacterium]|nr:LamG domain-containing protein [Sedimentisphaerales bacterium]
MDKRLFFLTTFVLLVCVVGPARAETILHWSLDGPPGQDVVSDTDKANGKVAQAFEDADLDPNATNAIKYALSNPWFGTAGTCAEFLNTLGDNDPGVGLWVEDGGTNSLVDLSNLSACTIETFVYVSEARQQVVIRKNNSPANGGIYYIDTREAGNFAVRLAGPEDDIGDGGGVCNDLLYEENDWYHVALVWDGEFVTFYVNGEQSQDLGPNSVSQLPFEGSIGDSSTALGIGCVIRDNESPPQNSGQYFQGRIDEVRISDDALDPSFFLLYGLAENAKRPNPTNYSENLCADEVVLCWTPGVYADEHDVYFGTDFDEVKDADKNSGVYRTTQDVNCWPTGLLDWGQTYYWRIDEVNGVDTWRGETWQFITNDRTSYDPVPADEETKVPLEQVLEWHPGCLASSHDVYIGTDFNDVNDATTASHPNVDYNNVGVSSYDPPGDLEYFTVYYWRVDDVNGGNRWKGEVWSFRSESAIVDPNLRLWLEFNETEGTIVHDSSGREYHGNGQDFYNDGWQPWDVNDGRCEPGSFKANSDQRIDFTKDVVATLEKEVSIAFWFKGADRDSDNWLFGSGSDNYHLAAAIPDDNGDIYWQAGTDPNDEQVWADARPKAWLSDWHHLTLIKDENAGTMSIYFDGEEEVTKSDVNTTALATISDIANNFRIGSNWANSDDFSGQIDDFRVYDRALSETEIAGLFRCGDVDLAWAPDPYDGEVDVARDANLIWKPGDYAASHDVYFGTAWDDVNDATTNDAEFQKNQSELEFEPGTLDLKETYYWRIDEVNDPNIWKGNVWRFTVADFIILDNFEQYDTDQKAIQYTWYDQYSQEWGETTGAWLELAKRPKPVNTGEQAVSYTYDTDDPWADLCYAEAWLPLEEIGGFQDWTSVDVRLLTVFFYGQAENDATEDEQMYIAVDDTLGAYAEMRYGDNEGEALADLLVEQWQRWDIPFKYFSDGNFAAVADDVNFSSIANVYIGFGNRRSPVCAGKGVVYFDDLRLSMPICKPEFGPAADFSGDCIVDIADVSKMGQQWLLRDVNFADDLGIDVQEPCDANLIGHWKLDEGTGTFAEDSSANDNHGTLQLTNAGGYSWVSGRIGNAVEFSGGRVKVPDTDDLKPDTNQVSVTAWIYIREDMSSGRVVVKGRNDHESYEIEVNDDDFFVFQFRDGKHSGHTRYEVNDVVWPNDWIHLAGTYDGSTLACYVNGQLSEAKDVNNPYGLARCPNDPGLAIGNEPDANESPFEGIIDDVRIYDYGLSHAEVAWLATKGTGEFLITSPVNLFSGEDPEVINFKDFAKLMESWLEERFWPPL